MTSSCSGPHLPGTTRPAHGDPRPRTIELGDRVMAVLRALPALGPLTIETLNASAAIATHAEYSPFQLDGSVGRVDAAGLLLRLRISSWARAVAIHDDAPAPGRTIEFLDPRARVLHRVRLDDPRRANDFDLVVERLAHGAAGLAHGSSTSLPPLPPLRRRVRATPTDLDRREVRAAWYSLVGSGDGGALVRHVGVSRGRVLQAIGQDWARPVAAAALGRALTIAAAEHIPISITVGNEGCTQTGWGPWQVACPARSVLTASAPHGRVVVHDEPGSACWVVREPRPSTAAWCLETHDRSGDLVLSVDVADPRDAAAATAWARALEDEPEVTPDHASAMTDRLP